MSATPSTALSPVVTHSIRAASPTASPVITQSSNPSSPVAVRIAIESQAEVKEISDRETPMNDVVAFQADIQLAIKKLHEQSNRILQSFCERDDMESDCSAFKEVIRAFPKPDKKQAEELKRRTKELLKQGKSCMKSDKNGFVPIAYAAFMGQKKVVSAILKWIREVKDENNLRPFKNKLDAFTHHANVACYYATLGGKVQVIDKLLSFSPHSFATIENRHTLYGKQIIQGIGTHFEEDFTALEVSLLLSSPNHETIAKTLISKNSVTINNPLFLQRGMNLLMLASAVASESILRFVLNSIKEEWWPKLERIPSKKLELADKWGQTALYYAAARPGFLVGTQLLVSEGASVYHAFFFRTGATRLSPALLALRTHQFEKCEFLLRRSLLDINQLLENIIPFRNLGALSILWYPEGRISDYSASGDYLLRDNFLYKVIEAGWIEALKIIDDKFREGRFDAKTTKLYNYGRFQFAKDLGKFDMIVALAQWNPGDCGHALDLLLHSPHPKYIEELLKLRRLSIEDIQKIIEKISDSIGYKERFDQEDIIVLKNMPVLFCSALKYHPIESDTLGGFRNRERNFAEWCVIQFFYRKFSIKPPASIGEFLQPLNPLQDLILLFEGADHLDPFEKSENLWHEIRELSNNLSGSDSYAIEMLAASKGIAPFFTMEIRDDIEWNIGCRSAYLEKMMQWNFRNFSFYCTQEVRKVIVQEYERALEENAKALADKKKPDEEDIIGVIQCAKRNVVENIITRLQSRSHPVVIPVETEGAQWIPQKHPLVTCTQEVLSRYVTDRVDSIVDRRDTEKDMQAVLEVEQYETRRKTYLEILSFLSRKFSADLLKIIHEYLCRPEKDNDPYLYNSAFDTFLLDSVPEDYYRESEKTLDFFFVFNYEGLLGEYFRLKLLEVQEEIVERESRNAKENRKGKDKKEKKETVETVATSTAAQPIPLLLSAHARALALPESTTASSSLVQIAAPLTVLTTAASPSR